MSFDIYRIEPFEGGRWNLQKVSPLPLGGPRGLFAQHLPGLVGDAPEWSVEPATLLGWAGIAESAAHVILFNLTPNKPEQVNLLKLEGAKGRTASLLTDIVFHFRVACASRDSAHLAHGDNGWVLPDWSRAPARFEYLRLAGGTKGGTWAWSEPPQSTSATVV